MFIESCLAPMNNIHPLRIMYFQYLYFLGIVLYLQHKDLPKKEI